MLSAFMRGVLLASGPLNAFGAVLFAPPMTALRQLLGLPEADPFYLWVLSAWVLAFGVAYVHMGWTGRADRGVLALGAWGKGVFAQLVLGLALQGRANGLAAIGALPDLCMAVVFASWLWAHRGHAPAGSAST